MTPTGSSGPGKPPNGKFLQPELYIIQKSMTIGGPYAEEKVTVTQLVRKGTILADFPTYPRMKKKGFGRSPIEAGDNVELDEGTYSLIASSSGYPKKLYLEQENGPDILVISIEPLIKVSYNKMQANLVIHPAIPNAPSLKTEKLDDLLSEAGITYGLDEQAINKALQISQGDLGDFDDFVIARGKFPGEGEDAWLKYEIEIGPLAGYRMKDGTIDFRDRRIMVGVKEGDLIATKIPAVPGETGYNVFGEPIEPKTGKDIKIKVQGHAKFIAEENRVIATNDGALSIVNNDTIKVATKVTIQSDVDYHTGNIESENNTVIKGTVNPGFTVKVGGDLEITGEVSSAIVTSGGNTVIKGGVTGQSSIITADGDVDLRFIERGRVFSGGLVVIRKQCYYSAIQANSDIRCHNDCSVLGGLIIAGGSLTLANVGAENCEPAILGAGVVPERYHMLLELQAELSKQQEEIIQALQLLGRAGRPKKIQKMEDAAATTKLQLLQLNLIPGTELYSRTGNATERDEVEDEDPIYLHGADIENIRIEVRGRVYAGTRLLLGNRSVTLKQDVENRQFRLSKNLKRIMAIPL